MATGPTTFRITGLVSLLNYDIYIDDVSVLATIICFSDDSKVYALDTKTNIQKDVLAKDVDPDIHHVYDIVNQKFIPIVHNEKTGYSKQFMLIKKDSLGENLPFEDFYVTGGHNIMYNGKVTKAKDIKEAVKVETENKPIYTIITQESVPILINGLPVMTFSKKKWDRHPVSKLI